MKNSKLGYKRYSPDVRKPYNVISSGRITMQDVDFPVFGIDNMGNAEMMYPGGEYEFPGSQVFEIPMAQEGMNVLDEFASGGLKQWFAEKWVDVKTGKECGRSGKDKDGRPYPACRPSRRVNSTTPKTTSEMSSSEKAKFKREKTSGQRIDYNHKKAQMGQYLSPVPIDPKAISNSVESAVSGAVNAFYNLFGSSDQPSQGTSSKPITPTDWTKMKRPEQIKYAIDQVAGLEPADRRKTVENLLESTAYMENRYGADPNAYGRSYTSSFMSLDPIAVDDMFTGRGDEGAYTKTQSSQFENFKRLNLPTEKNKFNTMLKKDNPIAAMAAARYRYALAPPALPDMNKVDDMFEYWLKYYNGNGILKYQTREQAYKTFLEGYKKALAND